MNRDEILSILKQVLAASHSDQAEAVLAVQDEQLTRFANSIIHQNTSQEDASLTVRLVSDQRIGIATCLLFLLGGLLLLLRVNPSAR